MRVKLLSIIALAALVPSVAHANEAEIELRGYISPSCSTLGQARFEAGQESDFRRDGTARILVDFRCNTAMSAVIESANGAFTNHAAIERGYTGGEARVPYDIGVRINGAFVATGLPSRMAAVERGGIRINPGLIVDDRGQMQVELNWTGSERIYAGRFSDNLTIFVFPAI